MSALGFDDRKNPSSILYYAPRRPRHLAAAAETTIRPVLERLRRNGEGAMPYVESPPNAPQAEEILLAFEPGPRRSAFAIAGHFAAAAAVCAGIGVLAVMLHRGEDRTQPTTLTAQPMPPKSQARFAADKPDAVAPVANREVQSETVGSGAGDEPPMPQAMDAAIPALSWPQAPLVMSAAGWMLPAAPQEAAVPQEPDAKVVAATPQDAVVKPVEPEAVKVKQEQSGEKQEPQHHRRASHSRHHHVARAASTPQPNEQSQAATADANANAPSQNDHSLNAALHRLFASPVQKQDSVQ